MASLREAPRLYQMRRTRKKETYREQGSGGAVDRQSLLDAFRLRQSPLSAQRRKRMIVPLSPTTTTSPVLPPHTPVGSSSSIASTAIQPGGQHRRTRRCQAPCSETHVPGAPLNQPSRERPLLPPHRGGHRTARPVVRYVGPAHRGGSLAARPSAFPRRAPRPARATEARGAGTVQTPAGQ